MAKALLDSLLPKQRTATE